MSVIPSDDVVGTVGGVVSLAMEHDAFTRREEAEAF
jgi:hypothetical protein